MTPIFAISILETLTKSARDNATKDALRLAAEALRNDPAPTIDAIHIATGRDVTVQSIRDPDGGGIVNAWVDRGASCSSKSLPEALEGLLEKVINK